MITIQQLQAMVPAKPSLVQLFYQPLVDSMAKYDISTPQRIAAFIAQVAHESGSFRYTEEIASGQAYEGRKDLGNTEQGDGVKFKGRGLIQITGRSNYAEVSKALGQDFISNPTLLAKIPYCVESAAWFWKKHGLNELADKGDFIRITKVINGGVNGLADRQANWVRAKGVLGVV